MTMLDCALMTERRLAHGLSQVALAQRLGITTTVIAGLERGTNAHNINLGLLSRIAEELGLHPAELLTRPPPSPPPASADEVKIEAALALIGKKVHPVDLARGLEWPLQRVNDALRRLRTARADSGQIVHYTGGRWGIAPQRSLLSKSEVERLERSVTTRDHLSVSHARVLLAALRGEIDGRWMADATADQKVGLSKLVRLGWVVASGSGAYVTAEAQQNLGCDTLQPA